VTLGKELLVTNSAFRNQMVLAHSSVRIILGPASSIEADRADPRLA
jgi:hypothetical protein